jgi:hypothetical protein
MATLGLNELKDSRAVNIYENLIQLTVRLLEIPWNMHAKNTSYKTIQQKTQTNKCGTVSFSVTLWRGGSYAAVNVNSVPPWSDTRHLFDTWEKNKRDKFRHFFTRDWISFRQKGLKAQSSPFFPCCERKARYSTPVLLVTNKYYSCWIGVVDLPRHRHG